jgi:hypothetical protein
LKPKHETIESQISIKFQNHDNIFQISNKFQSHYCLLKAKLETCIQFSIYLTVEVKLEQNKEILEKSEIRKEIIR